MAEAIEKLEYSRLSPKERRAYDRYVDIQRSNDSGLYTAKLKGRREGEAIGEARGLEKGKIEGRDEVLTLVAKGHYFDFGVLGIVFSANCVVEFQCFFGRSEEFCEHAVFVLAICRCFVCVCRHGGILL